MPGRMRKSMMNNVPKKSFTRGNRGGLLSRISVRESHILIWHGETREYKHEVLSVFVQI